MGSGYRQWKALMRKNVINWKRQPGCAFCEICCPAVVMFLMVILRNVVEVETTDLSALLKYRQPTYPGLNYDIATETWNSENVQAISATQQEFMKTSNYPNSTYYDDGTTYQVNKDFLGPLYFVPSDCMKMNSFQLPKVEMPIIAVVGDEDNVPNNIMMDYLTQLIDLQNDNVIAVNAFLKLTYGEKAEYPDFQFQRFATKEDLFAYTSNDTYTYNGGNVGICYGFQITQSGKEYDLELYFNDQQQMGGGLSIGIPNTQKPAYNPLATTPDTSGMTDYLNRGYSVLHNLAANVVLKQETGDENALITMLTAPMPATNDTSDPFTQVLTGVLPFLLLLIFIPPVYNTVFMMVKEKESRIKESMRMMGMKDYAYWLSWYVYYTAVSTCIVFLAWLVLLINVMDHSNSFLVLVFMIFYAQAVFGQIIFLQSMFESSKYSGLVGTLIYFGFNLLGIPVQQPDSPGASKLALSFIPQVAMQQTCAVFGNLEGSGVGLKFSNATEDINNYTFVTGLVMLMVSLLLFALLGFYLDKVLPKTYGEKLPACFCFTKKFCCCCSTQAGEANSVFDDNLNADELQRRGTLRDSNSRNTVSDPFELKYIKEENYEPVPPEVARMELDNQYMKIADLTKVYDNGFQAVNGINLKMYNGQIFALLGHNGAGKSTTISMLTGLLSKTTGSARIFENDMFGQMDEVRQYMGVCPQHDVLFDLLTPEEHLDIFYDFKGGDPALKEEEIRGLIVDVGVATDKAKVSGSLSGGNRRKLSVAIALCGNSRLVMLDEPTAGMDLSARRALWDMLKNYRNNRIIILTTHYMDEADVLGDRIGIMAKGKVLCLGSSLFLKNRYGAGYKLTMVKKFKHSNKKIGPYLQQVFGNVEKLSEVSQEITFKINYDQATHFADFFTEFDERMGELDIVSYGVSMTTLEEVFLKANGDHEDKKSGVPQVEPGTDEFYNQDVKEHRGSSINSRDKLRESTGIVEEGKAAERFNEESLDQGDQLSSENLVGKGSFGESIAALLVKRFNIYKRDKCGLVCEVLVPIILVVLGLSALQVAWLTDSPAFTLDTSAFPSPQRVLFNNAVVDTTATDQFTPQELFAKMPDSGTYFEVTYDSASTTYDEYYQAVDDQQLVGEEQPYRFGSYQIYQADKTTNNFQVNAFVNATSQISVPYFHQYMYQSILSNVDSEIKFNVQTAPFPVFYVFASRVASGQALDFSSIVSIALALIPCVIISFIIKEREQQVKHMQLISGVSLPAYWASNMIADIVKTYVPIFIILILQVIFDLQYDGVWELIILYPLVIVPFTYVTSFLFTGDTVAQIMTLFMHFMMGGIAPIVVFTLQNIPSTANLGDSMRWWFTPIPTYCIGHGIVWSSTWNLLNISRNGLIATGKYPDLVPINDNIYAFANLTGDYTIMIITGIVCSLLLVLIEADLFQCCAKFSVKRIPEPKHDLDFDEDVEAEENRLAQQRLGREFEERDENNAPLLDPENLNKSPSEMDVIRVYNFRKAYTTWFGDPFLAVERVSFGLDYGECFALLGVNGAGKSTTFKSLTRDIIPTDGQISIAGHNILTEFAEARKLIGYCPQHDALFPLMTVEEHLWFYVKIKGVPLERREGLVEDAIKQLSLSDQRTKPAGTLSGGNKRKLSVGIAIIGNPPIVLLDEPSAGMDPEARRFMWSVVEKISQRDKKSAVILTTHSMEEAEALSTKMGIMVRGGIFRCFGSSQHIKNKFATGYEVEIKIRKPNFEELEQFRDSLGLSGPLNKRQSLEEAKQILENSNLEGLIIDQLRKDGVGSDLFIEASVNDGLVRMSALVQFCFTQQSGFKFIATMCRMFEQAELLEQCGDFYKFRLPREDKSIGFLFGQIEQQKQELNIQEYGVQQTSLEQIFQNFAQVNYGDKAAYTFKINALDQLQLMNPDRKSTMAQKRMSMTGRKSEKALAQQNSIGGQAQGEGGPLLK